MTITFITPPLLQPNTPYPAAPMLCGFMRSQGFDARQHDFSLDLLLRLFTPEVIELAAEQAKNIIDDIDRDFFLHCKDNYKRTILQVISFLQGNNPMLAWHIVARSFLPEGPIFSSFAQNSGNTSYEEDILTAAFGTMGTVDKAKFLASLYLDDLAAFISQTLDPDFGFGKYAESLAVSLPTFDPILKRLEKTTEIDKILDQLTDNMLENDRPDAVAITIPFPGTLYCALRIARRIKQKSSAKVIIGGGYVNTELRNMEDRRIFDFVDFISFDQGFQPLTAILKNSLRQASKQKTGRVLSANGFMELTEKIEAPAIFVPDYDGLDLAKYFSIVEMPNPMHRIWTDGTWLKMQLSQGCYWHKCAFCDLSLDYIGRYEPGKPAQIVDAMEKLMADTGRTGFHFVDEAISPALIRGVCKEIIKRRIFPTWWGNIRFDKAFTYDLAHLMADAGCIAVTGGLECANDRLLKLMNKGITLADAKNTFMAFTSAGIMVHVYLMYAFPTQTKAEAMGALKFIRDCFADEFIQSAYWHRFALTTHSAITQNPQKFGITVIPPKNNGPRFALNELQYTEHRAPDWDSIGQGLKTALYNYMLGAGFTTSVKKWFEDL